MIIETIKNLLNGYCIPFSPFATALKTGDTTIFKEGDAVVLANPHLPQSVYIPIVTNWQAAFINALKTLPRSAKSLTNDEMRVIAALTMHIPLDSVISVEIPKSKPIYHLVQFDFVYQPTDCDYLSTEQFALDDDGDIHPKTARNKHLIFAYLRKINIGLGDETDIFNELNINNQILNQ